MGKFLNVLIIVFGVMIATYGEIDFVLIGVIFQIAGIVFEACRIVLVSKLLNGDEFKMEPLVSLFYFAPVCALMNFVVALFWEIPSLQWSEVQAVGFPIFLLNGCAAWALNCSVVFLVWSPFLSVPSNTLIIFPDRENIRSCTHTLWCIERYPPRRRLHLDLRNLCHPYTVVRLQHRPCWTCRLQVWND